MKEILKVCSIEEKRFREYHRDRSTLVLSYYSHLQHAAFPRRTPMRATCAWSPTRRRATLNADRKRLRAIVDIARVGWGALRVFRAGARKEVNEGENVNHTAIRDELTSVELGANGAESGCTSGAPAVVV